jgi:RNA polymerase sigma-32 factor
MQGGSATSRERTSYFEAIRRFPMLKADEEYRLAARWHEGGDASAAHRLLTSHLRLVAKVAMGYRRYGLSASDLIAEGNIGLMEALKRFEPDRGNRFSTYAVWWIKAAIQNYILRSWSLVRIGTTVNQKKLFFNLAKAKRQLSALQEGDLRPEQVSLIAGGLGVAENDVVDMNRRLSGDISLNASLNEDGDSGELQDRLVDEASDQESRLAESEETENRKRALQAALMVLNDRERQIFESRRLIDPPQTLEELAIEFRISRERVRQIEQTAFQKVQRTAHAACARRRYH